MAEKCQHASVTITQKFSCHYEHLHKHFLQGLLGMTVQGNATKDQSKPGKILFKTNYIIFF